MKIFGDRIDNILFPKKLKKFIPDELLIIENFIISLVKKFDGKLINSSKKDLFDDPNYITQLITKEINIGSDILSLNFQRFYCDSKKEFLKNYFHLFSYKLDEYEIDKNAPSSLPLEERKDTNKPLLKIFTGIRVTGTFNSKYLQIGSSPQGDYELCVPTRYNNNLQLLPLLKQEIVTIFNSKILTNVEKLLNERKR